MGKILSKKKTKRSKNNNSSTYVSKRTKSNFSFEPRHPIKRHKRIKFSRDHNVRIGSSAIIDKKRVLDLVIKVDKMLKLNPEYVDQDIFDENTPLDEIIDYLKKSLMKYEQLDLEELEYGITKMHFYDEEDEDVFTLISRVQPDQCNYNIFIGHLPILKKVNPAFYDFTVGIVALIHHVIGLEFPHNNWMEEVFNRLEEEADYYQSDDEETFSEYMKRIEYYKEKVFPYTRKLEKFTIGINMLRDMAMGYHPKGTLQKRFKHYVLNMLLPILDKGDHTHLSYAHGATFNEDGVICINETICFEWNDEDCIWNYHAETNNSYFQNGCVPEEMVRMINYDMKQMTRDEYVNEHEVLQTAKLLSVFRSLMVDQYYYYEKYQ